ncbi:MAG: hypothetical protein WBZ51_03895 [Xanthobacteraceae bacterium]
MLAREDRLFEHLLSALDAYLVVINFDDIDERSKVGLSERHRARGEVLAHGTAETFDQRRIDLNLGSRLLPGTFQRGLGPIAIRLQCGQSLLEHFINVQAVLNQPVQTLEPVLGIDNLALKSRHSSVHRGCQFRTPGRQRRKD